jgi:hypothetical protein
MNRRDALAMLGGLAFAGALPAHAQKSAVQ